MPVTAAQRPSLARLIRFPFRAFAAMLRRLLAPYFDQLALSVATAHDQSSDLRLRVDDLRLRVDDLGHRMSGVQQDLDQVHVAVAEIHGFLRDIWGWQADMQRGLQEHGLQIRDLSTDQSDTLRQVILPYIHALRVLESDVDRRIASIEDQLPAA